MKNIVFLIVLCFLLLVALSVVTLYGHEGYKPKNNGNQTEIQTVTVAQAKDLPDETMVILTGNIVRALGGERFAFRDSTGEIIIDIDRDDWRGISISEHKIVEIRGEVDIEKNQVIIDVDRIR